MTKHTYTQSGCTLEVEGCTWGGYKAKYSYSVDPANPPKTMQEAKRLAGDFESLTSAKVFVSETVATVTTKVKALK